MINRVYRLTSPYQFTEFFHEIPIESNKVLVRPTYMSICKADQRYFKGERSPEVLKSKLPMALIHECCGIVVYDKSGELIPGQKVVLYPNIAGIDNSNIIENYRPDSVFCSSGYDGFTSEFVALPKRNVLKYDGIPDEVAAITEMVSVACHAIETIKLYEQKPGLRIGVWGDGAISFSTSLMLRQIQPEANITVVGKHLEKINYFSFVDQRTSIDTLSDSMEFDVCIECVGGIRQQDCIKQIFSHIRPQGLVLLLGVSEQPVPMTTRTILEKGLRIVGCSRSGINDMKTALENMSKTAVIQQLSTIIQTQVNITSMRDITLAFEKDIINSFKTIMKWNI